MTVQQMDFRPFFSNCLRVVMPLESVDVIDDLVIGCSQLKSNNEYFKHSPSPDQQAQIGGHSERRVL